MKILVLSDSHSSLRFMFSCLEQIVPDVVIHLGDYFDDGAALREAFPGIRLYQVTGNCDRYRCPPGQPEILVERILGVNLYMTHGHCHNVKLTLTRLLQDARSCRADAVLYGHTHQPDCRLEPDGMRILNPGSCGYGGRTAGLIEVESGKIVSCRILRQEDLEERP